MKLWDYFWPQRKQKIYQFFLFCVSLHPGVHKSTTTHVCIPLLVNKVQWIWVVSESLFTSRGMHTCHGTVLNAHRRLTWKRRNCWIKCLFLFSYKYSCSFIIQLTTDVMWTILTMSLLPFWALNVVVPLVSMQGQKALGFHKNTLICVPKMNEGLRGLEWHEGE